MRKIVIIGATSRIAQEVARLMAAEGNQLFLVGRNENNLQTISNDLKIRGAKTASYFVMDATDYSKHSTLIEEAAEEMGGLDTVLIAHGSLPDQKKCEGSTEQTRHELDTNFLSSISLLTLIANKFEQQGKGTIAVISSVAGDRGRQSNYVYGTAKGALTIFMQGLRNRLRPSGVHVLTIKPGFVDTPMTADFKKGLLWAKPEKVAQDIYRAMENKKDEIYTPWFWGGVMMIIRLLPNALFNRLKL